MASTLTIQLPSQPRTYSIQIGEGILSGLGKACTQVLREKATVLVLIDTRVTDLYLGPAQSSLSDAGFTVEVMEIPSGEPSKSFEMAQAIFSKAQESRLTRHDAFLALGGGVIGDLTGYCAATYYRGVPFIQVPTTLLAQVDSSVGGKVAINFGAVKNCIGAFYQPKLVWMDTRVLSTLPERELKAGLAEVVKYAFLERTALQETYDSSKESLFEQLCRLGTSWRKEEISILTRCCALKAAVVERDETETLGALDASGRVCLNLGHTFAHAFESAAGYGTLLHGEAVSIGMVCAFQLAFDLEWIDPKTCESAIGLLQQLELITQLPQWF